MSDISLMNETKFPIMAMCPKVQMGEECTDIHCPYLHFQSLNINQGQVLRYLDAFDLKKETENGATQLLDSPESHITFTNNFSIKPIICQICYEIVKPEEAVKFNCCQVYCCKKCQETWKYKNCCPICNSSEHFQPNSEEIAEEVKKANKIFSIYKYEKEIIQ